MMVRLLGMVALLSLVFVSECRPEEKPSEREEDARKELARLQGTWQLDSHVSGDKDAAKIDVKKCTLFIGADLFLIREGERVIQAGILRLSTAKAPHRVDAVVRKGLHADNTMLGIYTLKNDTLEVCFDPEGEGRPSSFTVKPDTKHFKLIYKRVKTPDETISILGKYKSESDAGEGKKQVMLADIQKRGDTYLVRWLTEEGAVAYVGTGIRKGNILSVAWVNRGSIGLSVYSIEKGPKLIGTYTEVGSPGLMSKETLTAVGRDWVEVRLR